MSYSRPRLARSLSARIVFLLGFLPVFCISSGVAADIVTLEPTPGLPGGGNVSALAGPLFGSDIKSVDIFGPDGGVVSASLSGNAATHAYGVELDFSGGFAFFESEYSAPFTRTADEAHRASAESIFQFSVDVPTIFDIEGFFEVEDASGTTVPGNVELEIELLEFDSFGPGSPPPTPVFYSYQMSKSTLNQVFEVGAADGDADNELVGAPTGLLDPTKLYTYRTLVTINAIDTDGALTDGAASASGAHIIKFSSAIPEPSLAGVLVLASLLGLRSVRMRSAASR